MLSECWAPCFKLNSGYLRLELATKIIAVYTGVIHVVLLFYSIFIIMGGSSDTFFSPFFEFNRKTMTTLAIVLIVYCILYIFTCSYWLVKGVDTVSLSFQKPKIHFNFVLSKQETRFYYLPWLNLTAFEMFSMLFYSFFMIYRYYHNVKTFFQSKVQNLIAFFLSRAGPFSHLSSIGRLQATTFISTWWFYRSIDMLKRSRSPPSSCCIMIPFTIHTNILWLNFYFYTFYFFCRLPQLNRINSYYLLSTFVFVF